MKYLKKKHIRMIAIPLLLLFRLQSPQGKRTRFCVMYLLLVGGGGESEGECIIVYIAYFVITHC